MNKIAPSILSANFSCLAEEVKRVEVGGADLIHVDVMDGHFVPNLTIGPMVVAAIRKTTKLPLDVHLMIEKPEETVSQYVKAGADWVAIHVEATLDPMQTVQQITALGAKPVIVLKPETPLKAIYSVLPFVSRVLVMTVSPGFGGQSFRKEVLPKICDLSTYLQTHALATEIEVDGGINLETAPAVVQAGASILVAGSAIYGASDVGEMIRKLKAVV